MEFLEFNPKKVAKIVIIVIAVLFVLITVLNTMETVPTGHVGIKTRFGAVQNDIINEGLNIKAPFIEDIKIMDCRTQKTDVEGESSSKDLQAITTNLAVNYKVNKEKAFELYKTVGTDYENIIIVPAIQEAMKTALAQYNAEEIITKREQVAKELAEILEKKLVSRGIDIEAINIINLSFSQAFDDAIEKKQIAEQETKKAQQELEKVKIEAEKRVVQAQAEADSLKAQKEEITEELLKLRQIENEKEWIKKWNGQLPTTVLGGDNTIMYGISK